MDPAQSNIKLGSETNEHSESQPFDPTGRNSKFPLAKFFKKLLGVPAIIICGQLLLQLAGWIFFGIVWARGSISVKSFGVPPAVWFKPLTFVCTWVSTGLSFCATFLFSWGVREAITLHLRREGMSFATFLSSLQISSRSLIRDPKRLKLSALSLVVWGLASLQTAGWNTLLTPQVFIYNAGIRGRELDLSSSLLRPMLTSHALDKCMLNSSTLVSLSVGRTESGYARLNGDIDFPTSLTVMDNSYNTSTGGILPMSFDDGPSSFSDTGVMPAALPEPSSGPHYSQSRTASMNQQGFTADVTCNFRNLTANTTPSLIIQEGPAEGTAPSSFNMSSTCAIPDGLVPNTIWNVTSVFSYTGEGSGSLLMIACDGPAGSYTLIFHGRDNYHFMQTTLCTLTPIISNVHVEYSYGDFSATINATTLPGGVTDVGGPAGLSAVTTIFNMVSFAQALEANIVGDQLFSVLLQIPDSDRSVLSATEEYIRGVAEYSGTVFRACLSTTDGTFIDGVPQNMTLLSTGTLHTQFVGWALTPSSSWVLLPGTLMAIATIYVVLASTAKHAGDPKGTPFDPADPLDLVSASAAGGLSGVFTGTREDCAKAASDVHLMLGPIPGRGMGLKRV